MTTKQLDLDNRYKIHRRSSNAVASVLTITALVFAAYSATAMSSSSFISSSPLQAAYAQEEEQQQQQQDQSSSSAVANKATRISAAVDATLRYYARGIGAQYVETDVRPIAGAENINALEDVTIPSVPVGSTAEGGGGNTTGIASMGDYLIATGLIDKSYELFLETAREMRNVTIEDVNELQATLLQLHTLIDERAPYNLAEDVVQNLQGHLQRTVASTGEFATAGTATGTTTTTTDATTSTDGGATGTTDGGAATPSDTAGDATTSTTPSDTTGAEAGTTSDTTTAPSPLLE
jgi:hypothetical protein